MPAEIIQMLDVISKDLDQLRLDLYFGKKNILPKPAGEILAQKLATVIQSIQKLDSE